MPCCARQLGRAHEVLLLGLALDELAQALATRRRTAVVSVR